jgi:hypothetical protein
MHSVTVKQISFLMSALSDYYQGDWEEFEKDLAAKVEAGHLSEFEKVELINYLSWK